ncbi:hypothetical protein CEH05_07680 [Halobacillus halophilus]|uniref:DUF1657 domain-containing protein n=1 Tax=Halobacillus halophilus (strain ATCC 35676 / DSM 2266 / JCM 20832 / KCTC 3685 / LMG 17431 / NBRC 102448 / NCIMB 2269) TaxID=866895 RepID=I0JL55_HALH3|nr:DUF1657 domain-containing protein [Halobacillus halophilus]ASF38997.1 hypothetical protein CEH05_07680 [Halobacillus halophilus]CCG44875.1 hypothetical protein HBHAL_2530 [Halobacillus halophilus DSM 2266]
MTVGSNVKQCLATLKNIEARLSKLSIESSDEAARQLFHEQVLVMEEIKQDVKKRVMELEREEEEYKGF